MSDRITEIKARDLTLEHLFLSVEVVGTRASSSIETPYVGQLLRFKRAGKIYVTLGPSQNSVEVAVENGSTVKLLDAPKSDREPMNFGMSR